MIPTEMEALPSTVMGVDQQSRHGRTDDAETLREDRHSATTMNNEAITADGRVLNLKSSDLKK